MIKLRYRKLAEFATPWIEFSSAKELFKELDKLMADPAVLWAAYELDGKQAVYSPIFKEIGTCAILDANAQDVYFPRPFKESGEYSLKLEPEWGRTRSQLDHVFMRLCNGYEHCKPNQQRQLAFRHSRRNYHHRAEIELDMFDPPF